MAADKETEADSDKDTDMSTGTDLDIYLMTRTDNPVRLLQLSSKCSFVES